MNRQFNAIKTTLAAAVISFSALTGAAHAAESQSYTINLSATVPSDSFQVIPVDAGWIDQTQDMGYDIANSKLQVFEKQFQYKNTSGAIQATLTGNLNSDGKPQLSNGTDTIPLAVSFNNTKLSKTATEVVSESAAKAGGRTTLKITQDDDAALTVNGLFSGSVAMIFEPVVAGTP
ncbi:TPA: adhesin [Enterobacter cloacae]|uniref:CS1 type fimbrial major subunit n=1 Tax=Enterobacter sichuanensis TaxID=2071710 RepID=UPI00296C580F|nr:CS1 type fimbrial major subunit [Enterobacter sichuanensis]MEB5959766.1 fimbrial protein [Enterobacter sichuanensis]HAS1065209.1 adhesin [Enterobacter cloacae]HAS1098064.1 adhesin [Enterobacter cloacae]